MLVFVFRNLKYVRSELLEYNSETDNTLFREKPRELEQITYV